MFCEGRYKQGQRYGVRYYIEDIYADNKTEDETIADAHSKIRLFVQQLFPFSFKIEIIRQEIGRPRYPFTCVAWIDSLYKICLAFYVFLVCCFH